MKKQTSKSRQSKFTTTATTTATQQQQQSHCRQKTQHQAEPKNQMSFLCVGSLHISAAENDMHDFFGLRSTKYFQETSKVDLPLRKNNRQI